MRRHRERSKHTEEGVCLPITTNNICGTHIILFQYEFDVCIIILSSNLSRKAMNVEFYFIFERHLSRGIPGAV